MHHLRNLALAGVFVASTAITAAAEPGFVQLDRQDGTSRFGGELAFLATDDGIDATVLRLDLHGQYMLPMGLGIYGALPISYDSGDDSVLLDSGTGIGDLEGGVIFLPHMANPNFNLILHGGITLPIGSDSIDGFAANALGVEARPTDAVQIIPEGLTFRAAASGLLRSGAIFFRFDGGLDINLAQSGDGTTDPVVRINGGVGFDGGSWSVSGELINLISTDGDRSDQMANAFAIGFRAMSGNLRPYGSFVIGPDDDDFATSFAILGGLEVAIGATGNP